MRADAGHTLALILVMAGVTFLTRAIPFLLFDRGKKPPEGVLRLSRALPPAIIAMLVVYCLKDLSPAAPLPALATLAACALTVGLQLWKRNDLFSILGGTLLYMGLLQVV